MLDPKFIRSNSQIVKEALKKRNDSFDLGAFLNLDEERRKLQTSIEALYAEQNRLDREMKALLKEKKEGENASKRVCTRIKHGSSGPAP